jgi:2-polyprenyl-6-methoxyphenol hydroxylase-like FAD-dependent oxidoreductase
MSDVGMVLPDSVDVLIVGAGPAGLVAGIVLGSYGVDVVVFEKRALGSTLSRATVISTRCMEILRSWGLEADVRAGAADVVPRAWVTPSLLSGEGVEMPLGYPTRDEAATVSPTYPAWAPQDHLEPLLRAYLSGLSTARLWFGVQVEDIRQEHDSVTVTARHPVSGRIRTRARYVIGADGAHSTTRAAMRVSMEGRDDLAEFHRIEFHAPLEPLVGDRRYGLYVITNPDAAGVLVSRGQGNRWGFAREWRPGEARMVDAHEDELVALVTRAIGAPTALRLEQRSAFSFAAQIAPTYRDGRVFLVGDAAHRMTPRGGTGMNTAIQDGYDLGWRLAWVLRGWATAELLESYELVRRPVGVHHVQRAGQPDGARRDAHDALPWDLNGRVPHRWIETEHGPVSTLDLIAESLTLFAGPDEPRWSDVDLGTSAPVVVHTLNADDAAALDVAPSGARLFGPDAREIATWPTFDEHQQIGTSAPWLA